MPRLATKTMRSWLSESMISNGVMPAARSGTRSRSSSMPTPPRAAISSEELVRPAAPMSCTATTAPDLSACSVASSSTFSAKGSPTCTVGSRSVLLSSKASEAMVAPWMPSRPVRLPT